jgi:sugar lactone lactonase YvrE
MFGIAKEMSLNAPRSVSVDKLGNVYFTDSQNNAIRMVGVDGKMSTIAGLGDSDKDAYALQTQLVFPDSLIWHDQGLLFSDSTNRVRKLEGTNFESAFLLPR